MTSRINGIALVQVLLITAMLTVFVIFITLTARGQVNYAIQLDARMQALIEVRDSEAWVLYHLLNKRPLMASQQTTLDKSDLWYYDQPYSNGDSTVRIQDLSGLLYLRTTEEGDTLSKLLVSQGIGTVAAARIVDAMLDWQDRDDDRRPNGAEARAYSIGPRNLSMSFIDEIRWISGFSPAALDIIMRNTTALPVAGFNPILATEDILLALFPDRAAELIQLRRENRLSVSLFRDLTQQQQTETQRFFPSNRYRIRIQSEYGETRLSKSLVVEVNSYNTGTKPLLILANRWHTGI